MHFYFDYLHVDGFNFPENWEIISTESLGNGFNKSRVDANIQTDVEANNLTQELVGKFGACSLNIAQIKEACTVNDPDEMKVIFPVHREKIYQLAIQGDWQFE